MERRGLISLTYYLACSAILFLIGIYGLIVKRNMVLLITLELMMNVMNLAFNDFSRHGATGFTDPLAHAFAIVSMGIGGCIIALGLTITLHVYRHYNTLDVRKLRRLQS